MATTTSNYGFKKPEENDFYSIEDQNRNWDLADTKMAQLNSDMTALNNDLVPVRLWSGNVSSANTILQLSNSIDNYKTLIFLVGSPSSAGQLGWLTVPVRRWSEASWQYGENGRIAFPTSLGYIQLAVNSTLQITLLHADSSLRGIYGVVK